MYVLLCSQLLELELQRVVSHLMRELEIKPASLEKQYELLATEPRLSSTIHGLLVSSVYAILLLNTNNVL